MAFLLEKNSWFSQKLQVVTYMFSKSQVLLLLPTLEEELNTFQK